MAHAQSPETYFSCLNGDSAVVLSKEKDVFRLTVSKGVMIDFDATCPAKYVALLRDTDEKDMAFRYRATCHKPPEEDAPEVKFEVYEYSRFTGPDAPHYEKGAVIRQGVFIRQLYCTSQIESRINDLIKSQRKHKKMARSGY